MDEPLTLRRRVTASAWVGLIGGILFGLTEAWAILARNAAATMEAMFGIAAGVGFVVALDGLLAGLVLALLGLLAAQLGWLRRRFEAAPAWIGLSAAVLAASIVLALGLVRFGIVEGLVRGARALLLAGASAGLAGAAAVVIYLVIRSVLAGPASALNRWTRPAVAVIWLAAALLPLAYLVAGS